MTTDKPVIFVSYSRKDRKFRNVLEKHLRVEMRKRDRSERFELFIDERSIDPGDDWDTRIDSALQRSVVGVLLMSADFLNSTYVQSRELPAFARRHRAGICTILPLFVRSVRHRDFKVAFEDESGNEATIRLDKIQGLNDPLLRLDGLSPADREDRCSDYATRIFQAAEKSHKKNLRSWEKPSTGTRAEKSDTKSERLQIESGIGTPGCPSPNPPKPPRPAFWALALIIVGAMLWVALADLSSFWEDNGGRPEDQSTAKPTPPSTPDLEILGFIAMAPSDGSTPLTVRFKPIEPSPETTLELNVRISADENVELPDGGRVVDPRTGVFEVNLPGELAAGTKLEARLSWHQEGKAPSESLWVEASVPNREGPATPSPPKLRGLVTFATRQVTTFATRQVTGPDSIFTEVTIHLLKVRFEPVEPIADTTLELNVRVDGVEEDLELPEGRRIERPKAGEHSVKLPDTLAPGTKVYARLSWVRDGETLASSQWPEAVIPYLDMIEIPAGTYTLGSSEKEREEFSGGDKNLLKMMDHESPVREVDVGAFDMSQTEVTRKVWRSVMPIDKKRGWPPTSWAQDGSDDKLPALEVSWFDALEFCNALSIREGLEPAYVIERDAEDEVTRADWERNANGYRLPTEVEWECACRAGTTTPYPWEGTDEVLLFAYAGWYSPFMADLNPVATLPANAFGLHEMIGNVSEWCWDAYKEHRVLRGGSFNSFFKMDLRSASRDLLRPESRYDYVGFRCVRSSGH